MSDRMTPTPAVRHEPERFKRRQFVAPHRRRKLVYRLARPFLAALAIVGLPVVLVAWVLLSDRFAVSELAVVSTGRVPSTWAQESLGGFLGRHLFWVELEEVEATLMTHPWVDGVFLRKLPPNRLEVEIVERRPAALLLRDGDLYFLDRNGEEIAPYDPHAAFSDLVLLSIGEERAHLVSAGLELIDRWRRLRLPWGEGLSEVEVLGRTDFRVVVAGLPFPLLVSSLNLAEGLSALVRYRPQIERRLAHLTKVVSVDLRFEGLIVFQPAAPAPHNSEVEIDA